MRWVGLFTAVVAMSLAAATSASAAVLVPLAPAASWVSTPIFATSPPGDPRVFVVERAGAIRIVKDGTLLPAHFLDVPNVDTAGERGLLSMAFAPDYATTGLFYVFKVRQTPSAEIEVVEYKVSATNPDLADAASARIVITAPLSAATNHNAGQLAFGPDDFLYITIGENANGANAQTLANILGKVLRIDPRGSAPGQYTIPASNPFVGTAGARGEIWALGLRNPFRAGFTPDGRLVIGDVGSTIAEEVNLGTSGANYGWPTCEGPCSPSNASFKDPFFSYPHGSGCAAIIGGYVVRDPALTGLTGRYLYGDLCQSALKTLNLDVAGGDPQPAGLSYTTGQSLLSFGEDSRGCVYVMADFTAYRVAPSAGAGAACPVPPAPPPPDPGGTPPGNPPPTLRAILAAVKERLTMDGKGRVTLHLSCSGGLVCTGAISFRTAKATRAGGASRKRIVKLGTLRFKSLAANKQSALTLTLGAKARKIVRELRKLKVKLLVAGSERTTTLSAAR